jgi:hypothetical protein
MVVRVVVIVIMVVVIVTVAVRMIVGGSAHAAWESFKCSP